MKLGSALAHEIAHAWAGLVDVEAVGLQSTEKNFCIWRREPFLNPVHEAATTLAGLAFDMFYAGVLDDAALRQDPWKVAAEVRKFSCAHCDGSTIDDASSVMRMSDEKLVLALPAALIVASRTLSDYEFAEGAYDLVALTVASVVPKEKVVLIDRAQIQALNRRTKGKFEVVNWSEWYHDLPEDLIVQRDEELFQLSMRILDEMRRLGQIDASGINAAGLARLELNERS